MTIATIIQGMISNLGQSQGERLPAELAPDYFKVDDRDGAKLLAQARALAQQLRYYAHDPRVSSGDWRDFIPEVDDAALLANRNGDVAPHLGLLATALALYEQPQAEINAFTARHMDFQFNRVLGFQPLPARPDHAHLLIELKKGVEPVLVGTAQLFSAGKGADGVELLFRPVREVVVGQAKVAALHSVFRDASGIRFAPIANSVDGLGGALPEEQPKWPAFGEADLPHASIGLAFASPLLAMQEGVRQIRLVLTVAGIDPAVHTATLLSDSFDAYVTGPKGWLGAYQPNCTLSANTLTFAVTVPATDPAIQRYDAELHGMAFATRDPVIQLQVNPDAALKYPALEKLTLGTARIEVDVSGLASLDLENDNGKLDPKKAFQPFGAQPVAGGRFMIGSPEALGKRLTELKVVFKWQAPPANLASWYASYSRISSVTNGIRAKLTYQDRSGQTTSVSQTDILARDGNGVTTLSSDPPPPISVGVSQLIDQRLYSLLFSGSAIARLFGFRRTLVLPQLQRTTTVPPPSPRNGFITLSLEEDFLHADYRKETMEHAVKNDKVVLNEPYTPVIQGIHIDYSAESETVDLAAADEASFSNPDVQFFHVGCFGQMREHAFLRQHSKVAASKTVYLLPQYPDEGELLIGLADTGAGESLSLLFQVAEGSADPELAAQDIQWSVLCDNYWRVLTPQELTLDSSNDLRASGIVSMTLPHDVDLEHTWMPTGHVWLKAAIHQNSAAACQVIEVAANAVEVVYVENNPDTDSLHLAATIPAGSIAKQKLPVAEIKKLLQPYAGFGGKQKESSLMLTRRSAERLRHRSRCITPWDYERMLLEAFPEVHKVKCIPHANDSSWLAPGHVMIIAIPDLRNQNAVDPLRPRVDINTLTLMTEHAQAHSGGQVTVKVKNPRYQRVKVSFKVKLRPGFPFKFYRQTLERAITEALSPWAFDATRQIDFGGRIYSSVMLDFVEEQPYVDFVTDFRVDIVGDSNATLQDFAYLTASAPDIILVSDDSHSIEELLS